MQIQKRSRTCGKTAHTLHTSATHAQSPEPSFPLPPQRTPNEDILIHLSRTHTTHHNIASPQPILLQNRSPFKKPISVSNLLYPVIHPPNPSPPLQHPHTPTPLPPPHKHANIQRSPPPPIQQSNIRHRPLRSSKHPLIIHRPTISLRTIMYPHSTSLPPTRHLLLQRRRKNVTSIYLVIDMHYHYQTSTRPPNPRDTRKMGDFRRYS